MTCETCNGAVSLEESTPHTGEGQFEEKYECVNGHTGRITGEESASPRSWNKTGAVFQSW